MSDRPGAASAAVARALMLTSVGIALGFTGLGAALKNGQPEGAFGKLSRAMTMLCATSYIVPGSIHLWKEDGGALSIAQGVGWSFTGPVPDAMKPIVAMFATWGELKIVVGSLMVYTELCVPQHIPAVNLFVFLSNLNGYIRKLVGHKSLAQSFSLAPGRNRPDVMVRLSFVCFLLSCLRERKRR
eukprot:gnl/TRDRNA2_/TRDRNA2_48709_c0_seq1.p1 gnl/TRDRNA2_/TRDRNA2_48709_c0~~gnl/TRDRNA2_/TRDRNA2_48709_c0_seq1.p1  ORF type:complete len:185 (+),score=13.57 gnl/TRDRNA2_/TRDRNA2_48709_c0_seq1:70-624(+)